MIMPIVSKSEPITLVGGGPVKRETLELALSLAPLNAAADGGAATLLVHGCDPIAVIGDMDSIPKDLIDRIAKDRFHPVEEQDSTDFEKCLQRIAAPMLVGVGFLGKRLDHQMAVQTSLIRYAHIKCLLLGEVDAVFVVPPDFSIDLPKDTRVSLFPMGQVQMQSHGLQWCTDGLDFAPDAQIGTSNKSTGPVQLKPTRSKMLAILPVSHAKLIFDSLQHAKQWTVP
jgi:thiamine pyrophosphokinase